MGARVTMAQLAASLGVSISTISNAYHRPEKLSAALRTRVLEAADELGYAGPDPTARGLRRGRSGGIGVVFTDEMPFVFSDPASGGFLAGVSEVLAETDHHLILLPAGTPDLHKRAPIDRVAVDGVILHSMPQSDKTIELIRRRASPAVLVDQPGPVDGLGWVGLDEAAAMHDLGRHLAQLGHTRVGVITSRLTTAPYNGPATKSRWSRARFEIPRHRIWGVEQGLGRAVDVEERWNTSPTDGASAAAALLNRNPKLTAIVCIADTYALGVLQWAKWHHIQIPRQLSITGFDDVPGAATAGLTTIRQPFITKGRAAATILLTAIANNAVPQHKVIPTQLVHRSTAGAALI